MFPQIDVKLGGVRNVREDSGLKSFLDKYSSVFKDELETPGLQGQDSRGSECATKVARSVPYSMKCLVDQEIDRLVEEGILEPVTVAEWAAPVVPVLKSDKKSVRLCGDFKMTVNQASKLDRYPIPKIEDLLARLAGGKKFTKLDMSQVYQQILLEEDSKQYVVVNTHRGLFQYTRLPFGITRNFPAVNGKPTERDRWRSRVYR